MSKPLRTYSKRSRAAHDADDLPSVKRRRVEAVNPRTTPAISHARQAFETPKAADAKVETPSNSPRKKCSIRHFFRPALSSSPLLALSDTFSDPIIALFSPASSPPPRSSPPRQQSSPTTRCTPRDKTHILTDADDTGTDWEDSLAVDVDEPTASDPCLASIKVDERDGEKMPRGLYEGTQNLVNKGRRRLRLRDKERHSTLGRRNTSQPKSKAVQTVLSLTSEQSFTECRECNMVYNPIHSKDVRSHARRHAAVLRRKRVIS